jgi:hypothetical protein
MQPKDESKNINIKLIDISFIKFKYRKIKSQLVEDDYINKKNILLNDLYFSYKILNDSISIRCTTPESESDSFTTISLSPVVIYENDFVHIKDVLN